IGVALEPDNLGPRDTGASRFRARRGAERGIQHSPHVARAHPVTRGHRIVSAVRAKGDHVHRPAVRMNTDLAALLSRRCGPEADDAPPVSRDRQLRLRVDRVSLYRGPRDGAQLLAAGYVPDMERPIAEAPLGQPPPGRELNVSHVDSGRAVELRQLR